MTKRLIDFFAKSHAGSEKPASSYLWSGIVNTRHARLSRALLSGNPESVESALRDPEALWGIEHGCMFLWGEERTNSHLLNLARRTGVISIFNPEQPSPTDNWKCSDIAQLKADVEKVVGELKVPRGFVFESNEHGIPYTQFFRIAEWITVKMFLRRVPVSVLEIGAGVGGFALEAFKHGVKDYTIIDLTTTCVLSAFFMSKVLRQDQIWLYGEEETHNNPSGFSWIPANHIEVLNREYDLIINTNSFPEIEPQFQDCYIDLIYKCLSPNGVFYSANHESDTIGQRSVLCAVKANNKLELVFRAPYMMRPGYIEEIYTKR